MVRWHHQLDGHEFEQAVGVGEGQGGLACCSPWGQTWLSDWTVITTLGIWVQHACLMSSSRKRRNCLLQSKYVKVQEFRSMVWFPVPPSKLLLWWTLSLLQIFLTIHSIICIRKFCFTLTPNSVAYSALAFHANFLSYASLLFHPFFPVFVSLFKFSSSFFLVSVSAWNIWNSHFHWVKNCWIFDFLFMTYFTLYN